MLLESVRSRGTRCYGAVGSQETLVVLGVLEKTRIWVVVKIRVPFWGTLNIRGRIIIGIQKGTMILTTTHMANKPKPNRGLKLRASKGMLGGLRYGVMNN